MQEKYRNIQALPKAMAVALAIVVAASILFPVIAHAEEGDRPEDTQQGSEWIPSPGAPRATSSTTDRTIIWEWSAPTPTNTISLDEQTEQPTDIIEFKYELSQQETVSLNGSVGSDVLTVSTPVTENGEYTFKLWSVNRVGERSVPVYGNITIVSPIPVLPPLAPIEETTIPERIDVTPIVNLPASIRVTSTPKFNALMKETTAPLTNANSSVLSANDTPMVAQPPSATVAVGSSKQGWMLFSIPWYFWLVGVVILFAIMRSVPIGKHRRTPLADHS